MTIDVELTPTQQKLYGVLKDGECHKPAELLAVLDELSDANTLGRNISRLRERLYSVGLLVAGHSAGKAGVSSYQLVQRLKVSLD